MSSDGYRIASFSRNRNRVAVWSYVDTNKQVSDKDHLMVFASEDACENGLPRMTRKALCFGMT
jgi:hypothetical protein